MVVLAIGNQQKCFPFIGRTLHLLQAQVDGVVKRRQAFGSCEDHAILQPRNIRCESFLETRLLAERNQEEFISRWRPVTDLPTGSVTDVLTRTRSTSTLIVVLGSSEDPECAPLGRGQVRVRSIAMTATINVLQRVEFI
jgi:hypothetical protein